LRVNEKISACYADSWRSYTLLGHQRQIRAQRNVIWERLDNTLNESVFHECTNMFLIIPVNVSVMETRTSAIKIAEAVSHL